MQWTSIEDLLDQGVQTDGLVINITEQKDESQPDTVAPEAPIHEERSDDAGQVNSADLERLAAIVCDRISPLLDIEQERNGHPRSASIGPEHFGQLKPDALAQLTQEMAHQLYRRLEIEQERQGLTQGCFPW
ncbi:MAG: hypothetical protein WA902_22080 [Thermosynechococcaceae cyanobacterium]